MQRLPVHFPAGTQIETIYYEQWVFDTPCGNWNRDTCSAGQSILYMEKTGRRRVRLSLPLLAERRRCRLTGAA